MPEHVRITRNRREFLCDAFCGFGGLAFGAMLAREDARAAVMNPLAAKPPHMPDKAKAKSVIFLFMAGGPSHIETFDPKPLLNELHGQARPELSCGAHEGVLSEMPLLPRTHDATSTAVYIQAVVSGEKPAPAPLEHQVSLLLKAAAALEEETSLGKTA